MRYGGIGRFGVRAHGGIGNLVHNGSFRVSPAGSRSAANGTPHFGRSTRTAFICSSASADTDAGVGGHGDDGHLERRPSGGGVDAVLLVSRHLVDLVADRHVAQASSTIVATSCARTVENMRASTIQAAIADAGTFDDAHRVGPVVIEEQRRGAAGEAVHRGSRAGRNATAPRCRNERSTGASLLGRRTYIDAIPLPAFGAAAVRSARIASRATRRPSFEFAASGVLTSRWRMTDARGPGALDAPVGIGGVGGTAASAASGGVGARPALSGAAGCVGCGVAGGTGATALPARWCRPRRRLRRACRSSRVLRGDDDVLEVHAAAGRRR